MEFASFQVFDTAVFRYITADIDSYYVNHMSEYEHSVRKKYGLDAAQNQSSVLAAAALEGECSNLVVNPSREFLALIPFYGGLPPGVDAFMKVRSSGQGNSLVSAVNVVVIVMAIVCFLSLFLLLLKFLHSHFLPLCLRFFLCFYACIYCIFYLPLYSLMSNRQAKLLCAWLLYPPLYVL